MSQTSHPYGQRLVVLRGWKSRWFAAGEKYREYLRADALIREYLEKRLRGNFVSGIEIERSQKGVRVIVRSSRPGMIIGRSGEGAALLKKDLQRFMKRNSIVIPDDFKIDIAEVSSPESDAAIVAAMIAEALEKRTPFRRVIKSMMEKIMAQKNVQGARIVLAGRLDGAEMARREEIKRGGIPLQFLRADIDFSRERAHLPYGHIGIKVWIYKGDSLEQEQ